MKVAVLGRTGMLGGMVKMLLDGDSQFQVVSTDRDDLDVHPRTLNSIGSLLSNKLGLDVDYVINCIGAIKPTFAAAKKGSGDLSIPIYTNAVFPHQLAEWAELTNTKLIHITTDCVFDGADGLYTEESPHTASDEYGQTKSIGESEKAMVLRTSIIGPEWGGRRRSFLEWIKGESGKIRGYTNHLWNGVTTLELAHSIMDILDADIHQVGTYHVFSEDVSKYELCCAVNKAYDLGLEIEPVETDVPCDRRLRTVRDLNDYLQPSSLERMLTELAKFEAALNG